MDSLTEVKVSEGVTIPYVIETRRSSFTVRAFTTGLLSMFGHSPTLAIPDFDGEIVLNPGAIQQSSLRLVIHAASLEVTDDISKKDREEINRATRENVLEVEGYPEIIYECSRMTVNKTGEGQYSVVLNGELVLHGVTQDQPVSARFSVSGETLRAAGNFSVRMSDYEIRPVSAAGGTMKVKDELMLAFDISARKRV